jgi:hypothetical protein
MSGFRRFGLGSSKTRGPVLLDLPVVLRIQLSEREAPLVRNVAHFPIGEWRAVANLQSDNQFLAAY